MARRQIRGSSALYPAFYPKSNTDFGRCVLPPQNIPRFLENGDNGRGMGHALLDQERSTEDLQCLNSFLGPHGGIYEVANASPGIRTASRCHLTDRTQRPCRSPAQKAGQKRRRSSGSQMLFDDEDDEPKVSNDFDNGEVQYEVVTVGDQTRIKDICDNILGHIQEATLKKILKEWIKKVHPKKQSLYPYNGGKAKEPDKTKPPWWPEDLRHKEPDHLKKLERNTLTNHILRVAGFRCAILRQSTVDIAQKLEKKEKRELVPLLLDELYNIREQEERLERGEMDPGSEFQTPRRERFSFCRSNPKKAQAYSGPPKAKKLRRGKKTAESPVEYDNVGVQSDAVTSVDYLVGSLHNQTLRSNDTHTSEDFANFPAADNSQNQDLDFSDWDSMLLYSNDIYESPGFRGPGG